MSTTEHLDTIRRVLDGLGVPATSRFVPGRLEVRTELLDSPDAVRSRIEAFGPATGWVQTTSAVAPIAPDAVLPAGTILCAELASGTTSLHVRQSVKGWRLTTLERTDAERDGELLETVSYISRKGFETLRYEVAWRPERSSDVPFDVLAPYASRLTGGDR